MARIMLGTHADARRDAYLARLGYRVLRVEARLVLSELPLVVEDLLLSSERPIAKRKGPIDEVQRTFEAVTKLPRKQQRKARNGPSPRRAS